MSTPQAAPTSQASRIATTAPAGQTTTVMNSAAQPTAATTVPVANPPTATPSTLPAPVTSRPLVSAPGTLAEPEDLSYNEQLNNADRLWKFKFALRIALIIVSLVGIGCVAWAVDTAHRLIEGYNYGWDSTWTLPWGLITFSISVVYCFLCVMLFIMRKRPVHPGLRVAMDLLLWLGYIGTALLTLVAFYDVLNWGERGRLGYADGWSSQYGDYVLQRNNTWTWVQDSDTPGVTYERTCNTSFTNSYYYYADAPFNNCAEMDAYVNELWQSKPNRARVELTAVVCQWIGFVLHFALFVWACIDCHYHRKTIVSSDAEKIAAGIVQNMVQNGAIVPPPGQQHLYTRHPDWQQTYQGQHPMYAQMGNWGMQQMPMQTRGQQLPMQMRGQPRPFSGEQPLPPLPPRPDGAQVVPSNGKAPAENIAASYYEPQR